MENKKQRDAVPRLAREGLLSLLLLGVLIVGGVLVWRHTGNTGGLSSSTGAPAFAPAAGTGPLIPPVPLTAMYDESVEEQVAQGLHLSVAQMKAQLQAQPTPDLRVVAKQQGLAQDQLYTLVLNALQMADDRMVSTNLWTTQRANDEMQYWKQQSQLSLINGVASWFLQH